MKKIFVLTSIILFAFSSNIFAQPTTLIATNITNTTAELTWDDSACPGAVTLQYKVAGTSWPGIVINGANSPEIITGLITSTSYDWRVKCSGGGNPWAQETFSTAIGGCTDALACNYNPVATIDDGSCSMPGCTNSAAVNFDPSAGCDDGSCTLPTIDDAFITIPILCYGGFNNDEIQINVNQTTPATTYFYLIGYYPFPLAPTYFVSFGSANQVTTANTFNISSLPATYTTGLNLGDTIEYYVRLVDSLSYYNITGVGGNGSSTIGIYDEFGPISFSEPPPLTADTSHTNITCNSLANGTATAVNPSGGTPFSGANPYTYEWIDNGTGLPIGQTTQVATGLQAGSYSCIVSDANSCTYTTSSVTIIEPIVITPTGTASLFNLNGYQVSCNGASDGSITASATGGTGDFSYSIDGTIFDTINFFDSLSAGNYTITYEDLNGCSETQVIVLSEPPNLSGISSVSDDVLCYGASTGQISFTVNDPGIPAYQYTLDNVIFQSANIFSGLSGDTTYTITVEDNNGCQFSSAVYLPQPSQISAPLATKIDITCNGLGDGIADLVGSPSGGNPFSGLNPYTYEWIDDLTGLPIGQPTQTATGLLAGNYSCIVSDSNLCPVSTNSITIIDPSTISLDPALKTNITCNGLMNGIAKVLSPSGGTPFLVGNSYTYEWIDDATGLTIGQTNHIATGLSAGSYSCIVSDANSCPATSTSITIIDPPPISADPTTKTDMTCNGGNNGTATVVNPSGGTPFSIGNPYTYEWFDDASGLSIGQTTQIATGLPAGIYSCAISDSNSCLITASPVTIIDPTVITVDTTIKTDITCNGLIDGTATVVNPTGGAPFPGPNPYTFLWSPGGQTTQTAIGLSEGSYTCTISDAGGACPLITSVVIIEPNILQIDSTHFSDPSCFGANDGEILSIDVLGGTPPYEYSVNGGTHYSNMSYFNGYGPATYSVEVYDSNNCVAADYIIITEPDELVVDITTSGWVFNSNSGLYSYQIRCNGDNSGYADLAINGGVSPYNVLCLNNTGDTIHNSNSSYIDNLSAGTYTFKVIDYNGCNYSETIVFSEPDPIVHNFIPTHVTCDSWSNGSLIDAVSGGVGNATTYTYLWTVGNDTISNTYSLDSIAVGLYTMTVTDENNCQDDSSFFINDNNSLSASIINFQNITCFNYCDGKIRINANGGIPYINSGGNPMYNYQWNDVLSQTIVSTLDTAVGLCADNTSGSAQYTCIVTDAQGCSVTLSQTLSQPDSLDINATITSNNNQLYNFEDISCYGANDGSVRAVITGGNPGVKTFIWNTGFTQNHPFRSDINNLSAGTYTVVVNDNKGCTDTTKITLDEPSELVLTLSDTIDVSCYGFNDGKILAIADSGTAFYGIPPKYLYTVNDQTGVEVYRDTISEAIVENLSPGVYTVIVADMNGCADTSGSIYISQPADLLSIDLDSVDQYCTENNGRVISNVDGGTPPYTYFWSNGVSGSNTSIFNLSPGIYSVNVLDNNNCAIGDTIRVNASNEVFLPGNFSSFDTTICLGLTVPLEIEEKLGFTYVWRNNNDTLLNKLINNLTNESADIVVTPSDPTNIYTLSISDPSCGSYDIFATINIDFFDPQAFSNPEVEYGEHPVVLAGDNLGLYSGNSNGVEYIWRWFNDTIVNNNGSITVQDLSKSAYYYLEMRDNEGCVGYDSIYVVVGVKPYEAITPNNDGFNDTWTPLDIESYENAIVQIFNRWGSLVFESKGGLNYQAWDGTNEGEELTIGTYYYIIDLNTGDAPQTGPITIIR